MVLSDFQPGPYKSVLGRPQRAVIFAVEFLAGADYFRIQLQSMAPEGPPSLAPDNGFGIEERRPLLG